MLPVHRLIKGQRGAGMSVRITYKRPLAVFSFVFCLLNDRFYIIEQLSEFIDHLVLVLVEIQ